ncbi:MAG: hypothetical protein M3X11_04755 [Acidobacteriota bacterium]|nr:hypothetical protein [Acidobacteriota bacterium]
MGVLNDLLVRFENNEVRVLIKEADGSFNDAPDPVVINVEEGDRVRWSFVGRKLQILFGSNVPSNNNLRPSLEEPGSDIIENTPFATDTFTTEGGSPDFNENGAIFPDELLPLPKDFDGETEVEEKDFKYTINLTDLDGELHTLDPNVRRRRLRQRAND